MTKQSQDRLGTGSAISAVRDRLRIGTVPPIKPLIGITVDMDKEYIKLKKDYIRAVSDAGGLPFILVPSPLTGEGQGGGGERERSDGLRSVMRSTSEVRGDIAGIVDTIDGLLLTGGGDIPPEYYGEAISVPSDILKPVEKERLDFELSLLKEAMKKEKPILAICYGMQLVNTALGGTLYQDIELQVKDALNHRKVQHSIKVIKPLAFSLQPSAYTVNSSHHQAVKKLGRGLEAFAKSDDGIIEGVYKPVPAGLKRGPDYPFLVGVQWHPERDSGSDGISSSLFKAFVEESRKSK